MAHYVILVTRLPGDEFVRDEIVKGRVNTSPNEPATLLLELLPRNILQ